MSDKAIIVEGTGPFVVRVREGASETRHEVSVGDAGGRDPAALVRAAFLFLLDREPKEAILARFDLGVIPRYFPEFARELPRYLEKAR
jgi:hypothetical protein